jgi:DNA replication protein DnaC
MSPAVSLLLSCVHELLEVCDQKRLLRLQQQLAGYKLLIIDELGYVPLSQTGADPMMAKIRRYLGVKTWLPRSSTRSNQ